MTERLPAKVEAGAIMRGVEAQGGFATILKRGDPDRGALTLLVAERGEVKAVLERQMTADFSYEWSETRHSFAGEGRSLEKFLAAKRRFDPDSWLIELDVADAERFVAETVVSG